MAYVVADPCVKCKYTECVLVCPVDCFYEGENTLVINPDECIDCGQCVPACPASAIFEEGELPDKWHAYTSINAVFSGARSISDVDTDGWPQHLIDNASTWPYISTPVEPLPDADSFKSVSNKLNDLSPKPGAGS